MFDMDEGVKEAIERVDVRTDNVGDVSISVPGTREDGRWTSVERVAWSLAAAFLRARPEINDLMIPETLTGWRARATVELNLSLRKDDITPLDLELYLEATR